MSTPSSKLAAHIATLRKQEATAPKRPSRDSLLFWGTSSDTEYLHFLKTCVGSANTYLRTDAVTTLTQVALHCKAKGIGKVITSSPSLLAKLLAWDNRAAPQISNYMGSYFTIPSLDAVTGTPPIEVVIIPPLKSLITVPYGKFLTTRYITKLTKPDTWFKPTPFSWELLTASNEEAYYKSAKSAALICIDIETLRENATIRCLSYTSFFITGSAITSETVVLPLDSTYALSIMRKWNLLSAPKLFQNGKYDNAYLTRYNAPIYNWLYDTAHMFHCWYSELPKDLGFLNAFMLREAMYWKDLAKTNDLYEYYKYNALDTWGTGNAFLAMMLEAPQYAKDNYLLGFPLVFPCHLAEMTGIARDPEALARARSEQDAIVATKTASLNKILGIVPPASINVKSSPQMKLVLKMLGCSDLKSADEKSLIKARFRHPFNARVINLVLDIRAARTANEKYLQVGAKAKEFPIAGSVGADSGKTSRILFSLNPHGTDTSRLASREHHFWCGLQVQNIPRGRSIKQTLRADPGFLLCEVDLAQAESRDTAYISGDETLIHNVEHSPDFHSSNAAAFFGVAFEKIYDIVTGKVLDKPLRQLAKPVNHGANYNMGEYMLVQQMGEEMILKAKTLLGLPRFWSYVEVATYLLAAFHKTYPDIKGVFYKGVINEILTTGFLVHHIDTSGTELAWTRKCFGDPTKSKTTLNSYIAHPPQALNAQTLNKAWLKVFHTIAIHPKYAANFKLCAQIHDSILFQHRIGHDYLKDMVVERMQIPVTIKSYRDKAEYKTFTVPADATTSAQYWADLKD